MPWNSPAATPNRPPYTHTYTTYVTHITIHAAAPKLTSHTDTPSMLFHFLACSFSNEVVTCRRTGVAKEKGQTSSTQWNLHLTAVAPLCSFLAATRPVGDTKQLPFHMASVSCWHKVFQDSGIKWVIKLHLSSSQFSFFFFSFFSFFCCDGAARQVQVHFVLFCFVLPCFSSKVPVEVYICSFCFTDINI